MTSSLIALCSVRSRAIACSAIVATVVALAACGRADSQVLPGAAPPQVTVMTVEPRNVPVSYEYVGQTAGSHEVEVRARVTGILVRRNFQEGARVAAGQSLFTIDPAPFEAALARAEADLAAAEARRVQAARNAERLKPLLEARAVSQKDYDDATAGAAIGDADVKAAQARVTQARLDMEYTRVASPVSGIAGRALRSDGNYVSGPDVLLTTVTRVNPMYVLFGVPDDERLRLNREVEAGRLVLPKHGAFDVGVELAEGGMYANSGKLNFSDVRISGATGTSETRAELPNPAGLLRPGQFVRVFLKGAERPGAILVPQRAVLEGPQGKFTYVVNGDSKAEARPVEVGDWHQDNWIITAGLKAGDRVVVDGVMKIGPGAPVTAVPAAEPATAAAKVALRK